MLSRLSVNERTEDKVLQIRIEEPLFSLDIKWETLKSFSKVSDLTKRGWLSHMNNEKLQPYLPDGMNYL